MKCRLEFFYEYANGEIQKITMKKANTNRLPAFWSESLREERNLILEMNNAPRLERILVLITPA